ncbi:T9SS type A sorting domain-containing protein [Arcicella sp. LKC2W]|uniref:T9SS type A sorting domain-containing protein n=1 Tax=Arcicella sp. LKC2W TaxID=2984198 RepID=UPI002B20A42F|nr:T9SS type A sorting domain-containing protein [Arcicella sp. LKC2W]MEA5460190.1 T9SS type A sorting domain-containing protein [Arcicella sp. LKC2W]
MKVSKDGCVKLSEPFKISILIPLANESEVGEEEVQVYPNPSRGEFNVILSKSLQNADVQLFDSYGREHLLNYVNETVAIRGFQQGIYFLRVSKHDRSVTSKIVIE